MSRDSLNDITFKSISVKSSPTSDFSEIANSTRAQEIFGSMSINQSIFGSGGMNGFIILNDANPELAAIEFPSLSNILKSGTYIRFSFSTTNPDSSDNRETLVENLTFYVYNVSLISNIAPGTISPASSSSQSVSYRLEFASFESSMVNFREFPEFKNEGYIGKIAHIPKDDDDQKDNNQVSFINDVANTFGYFSPSTNNDEDDTSSNEINTCTEPPVIVETQNGVYFKPNQTSYPWGKPNGIPTLLDLIKACTNYAVPLGEPTNPSYVFFQDFTKWNFVPIGGSSGLKATRLDNGVDGESFHRYVFSNDENIFRRAESFKVETEADLLELQENGAFSGSYDCVEPNYRGIYSNIVVDANTPGKDTVDIINPGIRQNAYYHDFMSSGSHLKCTVVDYSYRDDFFTPIGGSEKEEEDIEYESNGILMSNEPIIDLNNADFFQRDFAPLDDPVYGYFNENYLNKPYLTDTESYSVSHGRDDKFMWQTMFDLTSLPFNTNPETGEIGIFDVVTKVKNPARKAKLAYSLLKDLKEQWNRYRHTICCDSDSPDEFMAMLVGFQSAEENVYIGDDPQGGTEDELLQQIFAPFGLTGPKGTTHPNLYRYAFVEVEVWPRQLIKILGDATDRIPEEFRDEYDSYFDYVSQKLDINPATGPYRDNICSEDRHTIFIPSGITGFTEDDDGNNTIPLDGKYLGVTFEFGLPHMNENEKLFMINAPQEVFVVPVEGGKQGLFTAYNMNELVNNKAFTNAGINELGYDYPEGFNLMPIGGMTAGLNLNGKESCPAEAFGEEPVVLPETYMGTVVKMKAIRESELNTIRATTTVDTDYDGPIIEDNPDASDTDKLLFLVNSIFGTENLPDPFCGSASQLFYFEVDDKTGKSLPVIIEREDKEERPNILDPAKPQSRKEEENTVYMFSAENDHDGRCALT